MVSKQKDHLKKGTIESDMKNLNNVFGIPLKSHWIFRGQAELMNHGNDESSIKKIEIPVVTRRSEKRNAFNEEGP